MTEQPQLHDLTKFILSRLESYPEEFFFSLTGPESKKWATSLSAIKYCGTPEDIAAINKAYMDRVLQNALKVLLVPENKQDDFTTDDVRYKATLRMPVLDESFTNAFYDIAGPAYVLMRNDGTTYTIPQHRVENDPPLLAAIQKLMLK